VRLDSKSRDILGFRPKIDFLEPDQEPSAPHPVAPPPDPPSIDDVKERREEIRKFARSVSTLARVVQGLIDKEAADVTMKLDPNVDAAVIQAMMRTYGIPGPITYDHFKQCEENLKKHGEKTAKKATFSQQEITDAREAILRKDITIGGIGTVEATNGGLRPELDKRNQIVEPIDQDALQGELYKVLTNTIWSRFFLPLFKPLPIVGSLMPDELVPVSETTKNMVGETKEKTKVPETETVEPKVEDLL
jgi:hypothetical protein